MRRLAFKSQPTQGGRVKMTYKERVELEKDNLNSIILHIDGGLFFKLYEHSAYAFCTRIKPYKVRVETTKTLLRPFLSVGVPVSKAVEKLSGYEISQDNPHYWVAKLQEPVDENIFQAWREHILKQNSVGEGVPSTEDVPQKYKEKDKKASILQRCFNEVKTLDLASMTPLEALLFLNSLQKKIKSL